MHCRKCPHTCNHPLARSPSRAVNPLRDNPLARYPSACSHDHPLTHSPSCDATPSRNNPRVHSPTPCLCNNPLAHSPCRAASPLAHSPTPRLQDHPLARSPSRDATLAMFIGSSSPSGASPLVPSQSQDVAPTSCMMFIVQSSPSHALTLAPSPTGEIAPPPTSVLIATSSTLGTSPLASSPSGLVHISRGSTLSTSCNVPSPPEGISNSDTVKRWRFAKLAKRQSHFLLSAFVKFFGMVQIIFCGGSFDVECFYDTMYVIMVKRSEKRGKKRRLCQKK